MKLNPTALTAITLAGLLASANVFAERVVNVYNWSDYIGEGVIEKFEKETGIKVTYDVFDSNEVLEGKLLAGRTGYDVVVPTIDFMGRQIKADIFKELDKSQLSNYGKLDTEFLGTLATLDPGNQYGIPYMWGTTGIGFNVKKVAEILGEDAPTDSWDLVFKKENLEKLSQCGVSFLDAPTEVYAAALHYLGKDPNSINPRDYSGEAKELLKSLAPSVTYFHSSKYIDDLAGGEICVSVGWSGDIAQAMADAEEAGNGVEIRYVIPKEGALLWADMFGIPSDATNVSEAYEFINFLMRPEIAAANTNEIWYPNPVVESLELIDEEIKSDESIYPPADVKAKLYTATVKPLKVDRVINRAWTEIKTGQ